MGFSPDIQKLKKLKLPVLGLCIGLLNGLFGAGGGLVAVPMLKSLGITGRNAHATSLAIILPLSLISGAFYFWSGQLIIADALVYLPFGVVGSLLGAYLLPRMNTVLLKRIFAVMLIFSAVRMLLR